MVWGVESLGPLYCVASAFALFKGSDSDQEDKDVSSIVQHYQTADVAYRETWRRAKQSAAHHRASSLSSQSENFSVVNGTQNPMNPAGSRVPGFTSFV